MTGKTTYYVTLPDGHVFQRGTTRHYSHAVAIRPSIPAELTAHAWEREHHHGKWGIVGFCGSQRRGRDPGDARRAVNAGVCRQCERRSKQLVTANRTGGGNYRRAPREYRSSICLPCAGALLERAPTYAMAT